MYKKWPAFALLIGLVTSLFAVPLAAAANGQAVANLGRGLPDNAAAAVGTNFPVQGTGTTAAGLPADFAGTFQASKFQVVNNQLVALGKLTGAVTVGGVETPVPEQDVTLPVKTINGKPLPTAGAFTDTAETADLTIAQAASCDILNLVLGPLHLDLLGLVVDLNEVILNLTAQSGPANIVGNLLCAVLGLLDQAGALTIIANLLQSILDILNLP